MRKPAGKRLPHGATSDLLLAAMWNIYMRAGRTEPVSRAELVKALSFPETTVDDRLRVLVKNGRVLKVGRGLYVPARRKDGEVTFDRYWRQRQPYTKHRSGYRWFAHYPRASGACRRRYPRRLSG